MREKINDDLANAILRLSEKDFWDLVFFSETFASTRSKYDEKLKSASGKGYREESEEHNYDEDIDQQEEQ